MITDAAASLASTVWTATAMLSRPTTRRRYVLGPDGQPPAKGLQTGTLGAMSWSKWDRQSDLRGIELNRMSDHSDSAGRRGTSEKWDVYQALIASGIFSKIDPDRVTAVSELLEPLRFSPGDVLDAQSDCGGCVYVI